ncbi:hypothetical protein MHL31_02550 [Lutibacter sp. A80]|uniref:hypothetical protein n=1 Tax=Lutibacter sp. A80 TaxID=2918453 RepID=UPI001F05EE90|nr:hypothetical protein [Lutibacter sp. A80]UMB61091.1 hypothetical protein MHL31_02550 [Lutibacter sp. A80]
MSDYKINDHIHLFSSWAAGRASSVKDNRFKVEIGQKILNKSTIKNFILNPDILPNSESEFKISHREWRQQIIDLAKEEGLQFTHGVSAKLINIYLKSIIICGGFYNHENARFIHPPIDRVLLKELARQNFNGKAKLWKRFENIAWSKFNSEQYEEVISEINIGLNEAPLWQIEKYWKGYQ